MSSLAQEPSSKHVPTLRLGSPAWFTNWFKPRSDDPATFFRERTIRTFSASMLVIALLSLIASLIFYSNSASAKSTAYIAVIGITAAVIIGAIVAIHRGYISASAWLLVSAFLIAAYGILLIDTYTSHLVVPIFMLVFLLWTLILPRNSLWMLLLSSVIGIPAIIMLQGAQSLSIGGLFGIIVDTSIPLLAEAIGLYVFRFEFDSRLENSEAARVRAEAADRLKTQFLSSVSHELRTPLNAIKGYVEIMLGGMAGTFTDKQIQLQQHIHTNAERLLALINDILDLAKIESGTVEVLLTLASPRKVVTEIVESNRSLIQKKPVALEVHVDEAVPETVQWDVNKVQQILTNLVANAIKFTDQGKVSVDVHNKDTMLQIVVSDTGIGMPADAPNYIFDMFRQVDGTDTRKHQGTGLGLTITKRLVDKMGGTISVATTQGQGSAFTVTLPRWMDAATKAVKA